MNKQNTLFSLACLVIIDFTSWTVDYSEILYVS